MTYLTWRCVFFVNGRLRGFAPGEQGNLGLLTLGGAFQSSVAHLNPQRNSFKAPGSRREACTVRFESGSRIESGSQGIGEDTQFLPVRPGWPDRAVGRGNPCVSATEPARGPAGACTLRHLPHGCGGPAWRSESARCLAQRTRSVQEHILTRTHIDDNTQCRREATYAPARRQVRCQRIRMPAHQDVRRRQIWP